MLDLFCGAGGAAVGYRRAGFDVVGVDINPQPNYPFEFHRGDALVVLDLLRALTSEATVREIPDAQYRWVREGAPFDAIHASPPCQAFTSMRVMPNAREHPDLVEPVRERVTTLGLPYVIENVPGAPLEVHPPSLLSDVAGVTLCGSMFGLNDGTYELRRHRLFESNVPLAQLPCRHRLPVVGFYGDHARTRQRTVAGHRDRGGDITGTARKMALVRDLMGIDWMEWSEANQAIPPAYTEWIGRCLVAVGRTPLPRS